MRRVLFCGSRDWDDPLAVELMVMSTVIETAPDPLTIVHGGARGADNMSGEVARGFGVPIEVFAADWRRYGKSAGFIRNEMMLESGISVVIAFKDNFILDGRGGTEHMCRISKASGVPVILVRHLGVRCTVEEL